jgi:hypothetical protein
MINVIAQCDLAQRLTGCDAFQGFAYLMLRQLVERCDPWTFAVMYAALCDRLSRARAGRGPQSPLQGRAAIKRVTGIR